MSDLDKQIAENAKKINTTEYKMSIGEIISTISKENSLLNKTLKISNDL